MLRQANRFSCCVDHTIATRTKGACPGKSPLLENLAAYIGRSDIVKPDDYGGAFKTFVTHDGHMWGLPIDGESTGLFYRTDLFAAAGIDHPPATWDEFAADAQKLTDPAKKQYGYE